MARKDRNGGDKDETESADGGVMLDPSLLFHEAKLGKIRRVIFGESSSLPYPVYVPDAFRKALDDVDPDEIILLANHYGTTANTAEVAKVKEVLGHPKVLSYSDEGEPGVNGDPETYRNRLQEEIGERLITDVVFEEWHYLQSHSLLASRVDDPFEAMIEAGAMAIRVGEETVLDSLGPGQAFAATGFSLADEPLGQIGKWVAIGFEHYTEEITLTEYIPQEVLWGIFWLYDPQD